MFTFSENSALHISIWGVTVEVRPPVLRVSGDGANPLRHLPPVLDKVLGFPCTKPFCLRPPLQHLPIQPPLLKPSESDEWPQSRLSGQTDPTAARISYVISPSSPWMEVQGRARINTFETIPLWNTLSGIQNAHFS